MVLIFSTPAAARASLLPRLIQRLTNGIKTQLRTNEGTESSLWRGFLVFGARGCYPAQMDPPWAKQHADRWGRLARDLTATRRLVKDEWPIEWKVIKDDSLLEAIFQSEA